MTEGMENPRKRGEVAELVLALRIVRSLIHNLPRSATADRIDMICADALGEPRTP